MWGTYQITDRFFVEIEMGKFSVSGEREIGGRDVCLRKPTNEQCRRRENEECRRRRSVVQSVRSSVCKGDGMREVDGMGKKRRDRGLASVLYFVWCGRFFR